MKNLFSVSLFLLLVAVSQTNLAEEKIVCTKGFQSKDGLCISQEMANFIACAAATGVKESDITSQIFSTNKTNGNAEIGAKWGSTGVKFGPTLGFKNEKEIYSLNYKSNSKGQLQICADIAKNAIEKKVTPKTIEQNSKTNSNTKSADVSDIEFNCNHKNINGNSVCVNGNGSTININQKKEPVFFKANADAININSIKFVSEKELSKKDLEEKFKTLPIKILQILESINEPMSAEEKREFLPLSVALPAFAPFVSDFVNLNSSLSNFENYSYSVTGKNISNINFEWLKFSVHFFDLNDVLLGSDLFYLNKVNANQNFKITKDFKTSNLSTIQIANLELSILD